MLPAVVAFVRSVVWWVGAVVRVESDVVGSLVGCSLGSTQLTDAGAAKIAAALPNSKLTYLK